MATAGMAPRSVNLRSLAGRCHGRHAITSIGGSARLDNLSPRCCKPGTDEVGNQVAIEVLGPHKFLGDALENAAEQLKL